MNSGSAHQPSLSRRQLLLGATAAGTASLSGCLTEDPPDATLSFELLETIDERALPRLTQYRTRDRTLQSYRRYDAASGADRVLILLHGGAFDSRCLQPLASYLSENNIANVVTPDLRGHGETPERRGDVDHIDHLRQDIDDLHDHLLNIYDSDSPLLVAGHSFGGGLAIRMAREDSIMFPDGYLLLSPYLGRNAPTTRPHCGGWARFDQDLIIPLTLANGFGITNLNDRTFIRFELPDDAMMDGAAAEYSYRLAASFQPDWNDDELLGVEEDTMVIIGAEDEAFYADLYPDTFDAVSGAKVTVMDDVPHLGTILDDRCFEPIAEWVESF